VAAYVVRSVTNNSVSNTVVTEFSKRNESYRNRLDLPLLAYCFLRQLNCASVGLLIKL
jgi:hypothetical protein